MSGFKGLCYKDSNDLLAIILDERVLAVSLDNELNMVVGENYPFYKTIDGKEIYNRSIELVSESVKKMDENFEPLEALYIFKQDYVYSPDEPSIYSIIDNGVIRHPMLDGDGVIRGLSNQLQSIYHKEQKNANTKKKMTP